MKPPARTIREAMIVMPKVAPNVAPTKATPAHVGHPHSNLGKFLHPKKGK